MSLTGAIQRECGGLLDGGGHLAERRRPQTGEKPPKKLFGCILPSLASLLRWRAGQGHRAQAAFPATDSLHNPGYITIYFCESSFEK